MLLLHPARRVLGLATLLLAAGCASAPAPAPAPAAPGEPRRVDLVCHDGARAAEFAKLGVPEGEEPVDVAVGGGAVWVRFDSGRLLRLVTAGEQLRVEMRLPERGEQWTAMDVDPADGTVWLVTDTLHLVRISTSGTALRSRLEGVTGSGEVLAARVHGGEVWLAPVCGEYGLLRFDGAGKLLGRALQFAPGEAPPDAPLAAVEAGCLGVRLEREPDGRLLAWSSLTRTTFALDAGGDWAAVETPLFSALPTGGSTARGVDVGGPNEQWFTGGALIGDLFYWKETPVFLGPPAAGGRAGASRVLLVNEEGRVRELVESCSGHLLRDVATGGDRYAAVTATHVVFGDLAKAPDLPAAR